ncbi:MAG: NADH-quinone oxidoreductase subunit N [Ilumatobacter sp.]|uniref:NADH-quinone oxidoreductase subunit N n=1 Tax=Ilumatobacter sp. TaxID=1967498 RepID=UPI002610D7EB|nr:NADH-quinone oxidoreductase subunit N [Ilumatobacter sp.]MDJ0770777.1 NADH-quinone oxidoreductase subunit N [Ilumatobacter sp.]
MSITSALVAQGSTYVSPDVEWFHLSPIIALVSGALFLLVVGALTPQWPRGLYAFVTAVTAGVAGGLAMFLWDDVTDQGEGTLVGGALAFDTFTQFLTITVCAATLLVALVSDDELRGGGKDGPEVYALFLVAATGAVVMGAANDLIVLFLGLETLSLALYVLAASDRERTASQESGIKYFVLGGFASAFFLYGIALIYGGTQSTNIGEIITSFQGSVLIEGNDALVLAGIALLIVGLGFKVAAVPFHVWTPDVYEGAPTNVTAFMASVGKAGAFAAMLRVLVIALPFHRDDWRPAIWALALLSLVIGSALAIIQTDVKRMLAYSSISHAGFILVGVEAAGHDAGEAIVGDGMPSVMTYLLLYSVLTIGSFAVVALVARSNGGDTSIEAFKGLAGRRPVIALCLTVFLLAQAGVPFTSGFVAKWGVIQAAVEEQSYAIAIIAMVSAVIAAFLYLRIMVNVWLEAGDEATQREPVPISTGLAVLASAAFTLFVGVWPGWLLDAADTVTQYAR